MCSPTLDSYFIKCYYFVELTLCAVFSAAAAVVAFLFSLFYLNFSWSYFKMIFSQNLRESIEIDRAIRLRFISIRNISNM